MRDLGAVGARVLAGARVTGALVGWGLMVGGGEMTVAVDNKCGKTRKSRLVCVVYR
jgi:hypothetical protein